MDSEVEISILLYSSYAVLISSSFDSVYPLNMPSLEGSSISLRKTAFVIYYHEDLGKVGAFFLTLE